MDRLTVGPQVGIHAKADCFLRVGERGILSRIISGAAGKSGTSAMKD